jgi:hypothetical protein
VIIPLSHENMHGRRWPIVTVAIITLNAIAFLGTHWTMEKEVNQTAEIQQHIILLAAAHPDTPMTAAEQKLVERFRQSQAKTWDVVSSPNHTPLNAWDVDMRSWTELRCEEEMTRLAGQMDQMRAESILGRFAFYPSHPSAISYLTANFLHEGWMP